MYVPLLGGNEMVVVHALSGPITQDEGVEIDELFRNRWRTLLSVDDAIAGVHATIEDLGLLNSTYFIITCATCSFFFFFFVREAGLLCSITRMTPTPLVWDFLFDLQVRSRIQSR